MKSKPKLRAKTTPLHSPASQVLDESKREPTRLQLDKCANNEFLIRKISIALSSMRVGVGHPNEKVEALFAARRKTVTNQLIN
jgi:hypothetical protein